MRARPFWLKTVCIALILGVGQQPGDGDGLVDPAEGALIVAVLLVVVAGVQHRRRVGGLHVDRRGGAAGAGLVVERLRLGRPPERGQRRGHLGGERPPQIRLGVPVDERPPAPAEVDRRLVEAHVDAVVKGLPESLGAGPAGSAPCSRWIRHGPEPERELARRDELRRPRVVQTRRVPPPRAGDRRTRVRVVAQAVAGDVGRGQPSDVPRRRRRPRLQRPDGERTAATRRARVNALRVPLQRPVERPRGTRPAPGWAGPTAATGPDDQGEQAPGRSGGATPRRVPGRSGRRRQGDR